VNERKPVTLAQKAAKDLLSIEEAAELAHVTRSTIKGRLDRGTLDYVKVRSKVQQRRLIPREALTRAGVIGERLTKTDAKLDRLVKRMRTRPGKPFTTNELMWETRLPRQPLVIAVRTLRSLGLVEEIIQRPETGRGGVPVSHWRWCK